MERVACSQGCLIADGVGSPWSSVEAPSLGRGSLASSSAVAAFAPTTGTGHALLLAGASTLGVATVVAGADVTGRVAGTNGKTVVAGAQEATGAASATRPPRPPPKAPKSNISPKNKRGVPPRRNTPCVIKSTLVRLGVNAAHPQGIGDLLNREYVGTNAHGNIVLIRRFVDMVEGIAHETIESAINAVERPKVSLTILNPLKIGYGHSPCVG